MVEKAAIAENKPAKATKPTKVGVVVKAAMDKTITVAVDRLVQHGKYKKIIKRSNKYLAHDEKGDAGVGDVVKIIECRPLSKRKNWRLLEIISKAK